MEQPRQLEAERDKAVAERLLPILRREPLSQAENKQHVGLPISYLFGPIRV